MDGLLAEPALPERRLELRLLDRRLHPCFQRTLRISNVLRLTRAAAARRICRPPTACDSVRVAIDLHFARNVVERVEAAFGASA